MVDEKPSDLIKLTTEIVPAYVRNNPVPVSGLSDRLSEFSIVQHPSTNAIRRTSASACGQSEKG
ncbi:hypothetical protein [Mesorhizobium sp. M4B.F.Ca.ET.017.02.2.1]|uniref:hypothetical protein n=1 Tax=Mesorhizobium sp. M4B.F.Ca.ET.017.02.2.1 TaxID=2496649 RepID=UPI000FCB7D20|nr:hypothetical protein [Mesorhizobium sp. M4B.F.Ca.ET.017.02.2.1]RVD31773.1 hypothetical protein EN738_00155 [Mesorhizobium sp. M4B.F.Ca.ET.017.02.2.1]